MPALEPDAEGEGVPEAEGAEVPVPAQVALVEAEASALPEGRHGLRPVSRSAMRGGLTVCEADTLALAEKV